MLDIPTSAAHDLSIVGRPLEPPKISQATVGLIISKYFNGLFGRYNLTCFQFPTALTRIFICALESL
jgi:hypothetical protein